MKIVANRIKSEMKIHKITQNELATKLHMSQSNLNHILNDKQEITLYALIELCKYFDVSADYILGLKDR